MKATVDVMTCDRCGKGEELRKERQGYLWGRIQAGHVNGHRCIGATGPRDLCPACIESLWSWWMAPREKPEAAA